MQTLIIVTHPNIEKSLVSKRWIAELNKHPEKYYVHELYKAYPDGKIDVEKEQRLVESFGNIVFQFPFYWFNCPPLLKQWLDEVLTYGWAYGSKSGYKVGRKKVALAISAGISEAEYRPGAKYKYTLETLTTPFQLTFEYVRADYRGIHVFYDVEHNVTEEWIESGVAPYLAFIDGLAQEKARPAEAERASY